MEIKLNKYQRAVLVGTALLIVIVQFVVFSDAGYEGFGWAFSFLIAGILLVVALIGKSADQIHNKETKTKEYIKNNKEKALQEIHSRALSAVELATYMGDKFYEFSKQNNIRPVADIMRKTTTGEIESIYVGYTLVYMCFILTITKKSIFERSAYKQYMIKGLMKWHKKHTDDLVKDMYEQQGVDPSKIDNDPKEYKQEIESLVNARLKSCDKVAVDCVENMNKALVMPLVPLYKNICPYFGGISDDNTLHSRFQPILSTLISETIDRFKEIGYA